VHQVEKFYGQRPALTVNNSHCKVCSKCVTGCPDSTPAPSPHLGGKTWPRRAAAFGLIGAFPGYVWGWFQVQDYPTLQLGLENIGNTYFFPILGGAITLALYALLISSIPMQKRKSVDRFFATAAVSCYYWYRIPWLFGFSPFEENGMLINLTDVIPLWLITLLPYCTTALFVWWIALRRNGLHAWMQRPPEKAGEQQPIAITVSV
jgi:ferredoxin